MASYLKHRPISRLDTRGREVPIPPGREIVSRVRRGHTHPGLPYRSQIEAVEEMLDETWPGWRMYQPFQEVAPSLSKRIKWLLKRRAVLLRGLDYGVLMVATVKKRSKHHAHPVRPPQGAADLELYYSRRELWHPPALEQPTVVRGAGHHVATLAEKLNTTTTRVEAALASMPVGFTPDLWVARYLKDHA